VGASIEVKPYGSMATHRDKTHYVYSDSTESYQKNSFDFARTGMELLVRYEHPLFNVLQLSGNLSVKQGLYDTRFEPTGSDTLDVNWHRFTNVNFDCGVTYYPDIRSTVSLDLTSSLALDGIYDEIPFIKDGFNNYNLNLTSLYDTDQKLDMSLSLYTTYQLTYRMQVYGGVTGSYAYEHDRDDTFWQLKSIQSGFGLNYRLF
jgi:hypothetical protein